MSQLILQLFHCFTYITAHFPTFLSLYLCHSSFSNPSIALTMSQLILQPFHCFTYITAHSPTFLLLYLCHSSFSNPSIASPTSQALHLHHLVSCPWFFLTLVQNRMLQCVLQAVHSLQKSGSNGHKMSLKFLKYAQSNQCCSMSDSSVSYAAAALTFE